MSMPGPGVFMEELLAELEGVALSLTARSARVGSSLMFIDI